MQRQFGLERDGKASHPDVWQWQLDPEGSLQPVGGLFWHACPGSDQFSEEHQVLHFQHAAFTQRQKL